MQPRPRLGWIAGQIHIELPSWLAGGLSLGRKTSEKWNCHGTAQIYGALLACCHRLAPSLLSPLSASSVPELRLLPATKLANLKTHTPLLIMTRPKILLLGEIEQ
jgi:hypothetical protein